MYRILWQYEVDADSAAEFERAYEESGVWCLFFRKGDGYVGTEFFRDMGRSGRYLTMDCWKTRERFRTLPGSESRRIRPHRPAMREADPG